MVTDTIKNLYSPQKVLGCVQKAMLGEAGDRLTELQQAIYEACVKTSPVLISRFEMSEEADNHSIFIIFFRSTQAIFVATLEDLKAIFVDSDHEFDASNTKLVMRTLVPLREGEDLGPIAPEDQDLLNKVKSLAVVLNPGPSIKPELN